MTAKLPVRTASETAEPSRSARPSSTRTRPHGHRAATDAAAADTATPKAKATGSVRRPVEEYVLEIKRSARRSSRAAGEWVHEVGPRRTFDSKALAREWAREASREERVWVQDAAPSDPRAVDGYLVGGRRGIPRTSAGRQSAFE